jgi:hypothetical protein
MGLDGMGWARCAAVPSREMGGGGSTTTTDHVI